MLEEAEEGTELGEGENMGSTTGLLPPALVVITVSIELSWLLFTPELLPPVQLTTELDPSAIRCAPLLLIGVMVVVSFELAVTSALVLIITLLGPMLN